jgi:hypothetical protein
LPDGSQINDRREHCSVHNETIRQLNKIEIDGAVTKNEIINLSKRINGALDKIKDHMDAGSKWRLGLVGACITIMLSLLSGIFGYGLLTARVDESHRNIAKIEKMFDKVIDKIDELHGVSR